MPSELIDRLPATIEGLIPEGWSIVLDGGDEVRACWRDADGDMWTYPGGFPRTAKQLGMPLTDRTSRAHAAWWCDNGDRNVWLWSHDERNVIDFAIRGESMTPRQIDTLARLVLRLAGVTDA